MGEAKRVLFRYDANDHPLLDEWLTNQSNKTQSIIHALERTIVDTGVEQDLVKQALTTSLKQQIDTKKSEQTGDDV